MNSTLRIILLFFFLGFLSGELAGQKWLKPGYLISEDDDTIRGYINIRKSLRDDHYVWFGAGGRSSLRPVEAEAVKGYRLDDGLNMVSRNVTLNGVTRTRFVEYLVNGIVDLYLISEEGDYLYLVEIEGKDPVVLDDKFKTLERDQDTYQVKSHQYIGVLKAAMSDCPDVFPQIEEMTLSPNNLIRLSRDYHQYMCKPGEPCMVYQRDPIKAMSVFSPEAGAGMGFIRLLATSSGEKVSMPGKPFVFAGLNTCIPVYRGLDEVDVELSIVAGQKSYYGEYLVYDDLYTNVRMFDYSSFSLMNSVGIRYKTQAEKLILSAYAGIVLDINFSTELNGSYDRYYQDEYVGNIAIPVNFYPGRMGGLRGEITLFTPVLYDNFLKFSVGGQALFARKPLHIISSFTDEYRITESTIYLKAGWCF